MPVDGRRNLIREAGPLSLDRMAISQRAPYLFLTEPME
jgi:hypothetical protein